MMLHSRHLFTPWCPYEEHVNKFDTISMPTMFVNSFYNDFIYIVFSHVYHAYEKYKFPLSMFPLYTVLKLCCLLQMSKFHLCVLFGHARDWSTLILPIGSVLHVHIYILLNQVNRLNYSIWLCSLSTAQTSAWSTGKFSLGLLFVLSMFHIFLSLHP